MSAGDADAVRRLAAKLARMESAIEQHDRRLNNIFREARVLEVKPEEGLVKVEAAGLPTDFVPWMEIAGGVRTWDPPVKDQRVLFVSPSGEPGQGFVLPGGFSEAYGQPSQSGEESVKVVGASSFTMRDGEIEIRTGHLKIYADQVDVY
ncbi:phage baseplate assembly protein V [Acuticoccus sp. M5D2P5]|uniref:phage baseplate assembly protein V n=1 Tax=Acuticoccus kalidii TaxID=2910977 RepID=UPI001F3B6FBE|nr:phage baseplate assembly protein V [Acuticoccus kalidii]MCF3935011.1 phage baseplate assembly protein V [Acuticoccus kalidii]